MLQPGLVVISTNRRQRLDVFWETQDWFISAEVHQLLTTFFSLHRLQVCLRKSSAFYLKCKQNKHGTSILSYTIWYSEFNVLDGKADDMDSSVSTPNRK